MANVQTSIDIAAPVERVCQLVTDLARLGESSLARLQNAEG